MEQISTLQRMEYLETGFKVSKILTRAGYAMDAPAWTITWGQVAEALAHTLADHGIPVDRLEEIQLVELAKEVQKALAQEDSLNQISLTSTRVLQPLLELPEPDRDDEGPFTEQFENAVRLMDDEAYWPDGGLSAGFGEDF